MILTKKPQEIKLIYLSLHAAELNKKEQEERLTNLLKFRIDVAYQRFCLIVVEKVQLFLDL